MVRIYLDSLLLLIGGTFALEFLTLWAVGQISRRPTRAPRLAGAALVTALSFVTVVALSDLESSCSSITYVNGDCALASGASLSIAYSGMNLREFVTSSFTDTCLH